jgi:hypothetical protein
MPLELEAGFGAPVPILLCAIHPIHALRTMRIHTHLHLVLLYPLIHPLAFIRERSSVINASNGFFLVLLFVCRHFRRCKLVDSDLLVFIRISLILRLFGSRSSSSLWEYLFSQVALTFAAEECGCSSLLYINSIDQMLAFLILYSVSFCLTITHRFVSPYRQ